ncbi:hypothetical protein [Haladaptatus cibarius]|uniref:hypothetical protein n=1 Tax=Haladaptatus cibarius TaxID=453847 RepID=UPI000678BAFB|nr:hypothetical protein [Haladaptatus cibarius]
MTFESAIQADYGTMLAGLRDTVGGLTNWTIKDDSSDGAAQLAKGDYFVLTTSDPQEDIYLGVEANLGGLVIQHGPSWDAANGQWTDRYQFDPAQTGQNYPQYRYENNQDVHPDEHFQLLPKTKVHSDFPMQMGDSGTYWLSATDEKGFQLYWQREIADGDDGELFVGAGKITRAWDYTAADEREAGWALGYGDTNNGLKPVHMSESGHYNNSSDFNGDNRYEHHVGNKDQPAHGHVNPDAEFDNYPLTNSVVSSRQYRNVEGHDTVIGDFDNWVQDESGSSTGHKDEVQDAGGAGVYTVCKRHSSLSVALRMD